MQCLLPKTHVKTFLLHSATRRCWPAPSCQRSTAVPKRSARCSCRLKTAPSGTRIMWSNCELWWLASWRSVTRPSRYAKLRGPCPPLALCMWYDTFQCAHTVASPLAYEDDYAVINLPWLLSRVNFALNDCRALYPVSLCVQRHVMQWLALWRSVTKPSTRNFVEYAPKHFCVAWEEFLWSCPYARGTLQCKHTVTSPWLTRVCWFGINLPRLNCHERPKCGKLMWIVFANPIATKNETADKDGGFDLCIFFCDWLFVLWYSSSVDCVRCRSGVVS